MEFLHRNYRVLFPVVVKKVLNPKEIIRIGLLGASKIAYASLSITPSPLLDLADADVNGNRPQAIINPAKTHPEVVISAVAARDRKRAERYAKRWGIERVFGGYLGGFFLVFVFWRGTFGD
jgi:hypothetical protein